MSKSKLMGRLLQTTVLAGVAALSSPAFAQDTPGSAPELRDADDTIVVTGSRIARPEVEANSPVTVVGAEEFRFTGTVNTEQLLNELPQVVPGLGGQTNNPGDGTATINLRGLGAARTLVLVNGVRQTPTTIAGVVDLNVIPAALIERTEVLTGGAASIYGSDAVAGVVNFILRDDFEGLQIDGQYEQTEEDDGQIFNLNATAGANFADGRGNVVFHAGYTNRQSVFQGDRGFSEVAFLDFTGGIDEEGEFVPPERVPGGSSATPSPTLQGSLAGFEFDRQGNPIPSQGLYNYAPVNYLQLPQDRYNIYTSATYEISDSVAFYASGLYTQNQAATQLAPTPLAQGVFGTPTLDINIDENPFVTDDFRDFLVANLDDDGDGILDLDADGDGLRDDDSDSVVPIRLRRRLTEVGARREVTNRDAFQIRAGFRGDFGAQDGFLADWRWDTLFQFGRVNESFVQEGNVSLNRIAQAANAVVDDDGDIVCADPSGGCVALNLFGEGTISPAAADFIDVTTVGTTERDQRLIIGTVSGPLPITSPIANSPVAVAAGVEYREDEGDFRPSELLAIGDISGFNGAAPVGGSVDVYEVFGEVLVPLIEGQPFVDELTVEGSYRNSNYSTIDDNVESYAVSGRWSPVPDLLFRGSYARAVRAPNIIELFGPQNENFPAAFDPCGTTALAPGETLSDAVRDICVATGVPAAAIDSGSFTAPDAQLRSIVGGNPNLNEEVADTFTVGAVIEPSFAQGLLVAIDYFDIEVEDAIASFGGGAANVVATCYSDANTLGAANPFCQVIERGTSGLIDQILLTDQNVASIETSGVDLRVTYDFDPADVSPGWEFGSFRFDYLGTYTIKDDTQPDATADVIECAGNFGDRCGSPQPDYSHVFTTRWAFDKLTAQLRWQYISEYDDERIENDDLEARFIVAPTLDAVNYFDLTGQYEINEGLRLTGGVRNLTDEEPPLTGFGQQANTFPARYDVLGRTYFIGATLDF
jgi:outer membrane receptor protein involved in Fe transport